MKKQMILAAVISLVVLAASGVTYALTHIRPLFSVAVTFGTVFYHLAVRLAIGGLINAKYHNHMDYTRICSFRRYSNFSPELPFFSC